MEGTSSYVGSQSGSRSGSGCEGCSSRWAIASCNTRDGGLRSL